MKPAPFDYVRAESLDEALQVLAREGADARVIAGGQSLMPMLTMRLAKPTVLVDVMRLKPLAAPTREADAIVVPAAVRQAALLAWPPLARPISRCSPPRCPGSVTARPAAVAPSAARSRMPIQAPRFRSASSPPKARSSSARASAPGACRPSRFLPAP